MLYVIEELSVSAIMKPFKCSATEERQRERNACKHRHCEKWVNRFEFISSYALSYCRFHVKKCRHFFFALRTGCNVLLSGDYKKMPVLFHFCRLLLIALRSRKRKQWHSCCSLEFHPNSKLLDTFHERKQQHNNNNNGKITGISEICIDVATYRWIWNKWNFPLAAKTSRTRMLKVKLVHANQISDKYKTKAMKVKWSIYSSKM